MTRQVQLIPAIILIFFTVCTEVFKVSGQVVDTVIQKNFAEFYSFPEGFKNFHYQRDSIMCETYFYDMLKQTEINLPRTGNPGSAHFDFFRNYRASKFFSDGFSQYDNYFLDPFREKSFASERRFTNINYHIGSKKEQHIFVRHEQKIRPWMIAGLDLGALTSQSDYARTLNNNRNFDIYFQYESRSKVYRAYTSYTANRALNEENGGISTDSVFEKASSLNTRTLPINLPQAENKYRLRDYVLKQELNISRLFREKDTTAKYHQFREGSLVLSHDLWWDRKSVLFTSVNPDSGYFEHFYFDTTATYDSSFYKDLYQDALLDYTWKAGSESFISAGAGFEYQLTDYSTGPVDSSFDSGAALFRSSFRSRTFIGSVSLSKAVTGDSKNCYRSGIQLEYWAPSGKLLGYINGSASRLPQDVRDRLYVSNHFIWNNDFDDATEYLLTAGVSIKKPAMSLIYRTRTVENMVFYREDYLPQTYHNFISVSDITLSHATKIGKFGIDDRIAFSFTGNEQVAPVPLWKIFASLYYENRFFKQVLGFKAGLDVNSYSSYYGYGYMPATGIYYVQHEKKIGNYPELGAFVTLRIKQAARLFIRLDNWNAGLGDRTYYGAIHYPLPGRTFKFGVSWDLVD